MTKYLDVLYNHLPAFFDNSKVERVFIIIVHPDACLPPHREVLNIVFSFVFLKVQI